MLQVYERGVKDLSYQPKINISSKQLSTVAFLFSVWFLSCRCRVKFSSHVRSALQSFHFNYLGNFQPHSKKFLFKVAGADVLYLQALTL